MSPLLSDAGPSPLQIVINPNLPLSECPVVALSVAVLTNTVDDFDLLSDHRCKITVMGLAHSEGFAVGDLAIARYIARRAAKQEIMPSSPETAGLIDSWVEYAQCVRKSDRDDSVVAICLSIEEFLRDQTYLVGSCITMADLSMFAAIGFPTQSHDLTKCLSNMSVNATAARRWVKMMSRHPALQEAAQLCVGVANSSDAFFDPTNDLQPLVPGMNTLEGAVAGRVVTRFPPEPSGK